VAPAETESSNQTDWLFVVLTTFPAASSFDSVVSPVAPGVVSRDSRQI
jgi:hypothetical protein